MKKLPILKFDPMFVPVVWGGRSLDHVLNKSLPPDKQIGESWEICDLDSHQSVISDGELAGRTLESLVKEYHDELLGSASLLDGRFPLLFKFIDAHRTLSVQVHPDFDACRAIGQGARPKTEAWYIIDCIKDAFLYVGLKDGVKKEDFESALKDGQVEALLNKKYVKPGDYVFLPSGTLHAIGDGIILAEVQQSSNTTYRVFDWNRMGFDGKPRELHVKQALASIHFNEFEEPEITPPSSGRSGIKCDYFEMETGMLSAGQSIELASTGPVAVMFVKGEGVLKVKTGSSAKTASIGETLLIPASIAEQITITATASLQCVVTKIP